MKILFLQEFVREDHMKQEAPGEWKNIFMSTKAGGTLRKAVEGEMGLKRSNYYIDYAFGRVPKVLSRDGRGRANKYKPPTQKEAAPEYEHLYKRIVKEKPDIIVPTGNLGCKALVGKAAISSLRGVPQKVTVKADIMDDADIGPAKYLHPDDLAPLQDKLHNAEEALAVFRKLYPPERIEKYKDLQRELATLEGDVENFRKQLEDKPATANEHTCWVLPMFSMEYMFVNPSCSNLVESDFITLTKFVEQGERAFEASPVEYEFVTNIDRVREIFEKEIPAAPMTAWDLETNTLRGELPGAKALVISLSWKEGEGVTIPLEHKEHQWLPGYLAEIYHYIEAFVGNPDIPKVGHNIKFDIRFLRLTKGFTKFANIRDTMIMYYLLVTQEVESSLRLSDLSYELTDMGGYDKPLEEYKKDYVKNYVENRKLEIARLKEEHKARQEYEKQQAKAEGRKAEKLPKPDFGKAESPKNEIDGGDFNYEWIPLEILHPYASGDVDSCLRIHNRLDKTGQKPEHKRQRDLYTLHYPDMSAYLAKVEANGVLMDREYNMALIQAYGDEEERLLQEMRKFPEVQQLESEHLSLYQRGLEEKAKPKSERDEEIAKFDKYKDKLIFNPNSSEDKQKVLFEYTGFRLPYNKENLVDSAFEDGIPEEEIEWFHYKANKHALGIVAEQCEQVSKLAELLLEHSLVKTRKQNFTYKLLAMTDPEGRIHGGFSPTGTATSRLSSQSPNLQQMPRKTGDPSRFDYKHPIKKMFITSFPGGALLQLDYSSLESRILGLAAGDEEMTQAFLDGKDLHVETATFVYGVKPEEVTKDMRSMAKAVTFGLAYGETPFSFAPKQNMTVEEAEVVFDKYFKNKPRVKEFIDKTHERVLRDGYVECLQGFRRNLREVYSQDKSKRNAALRQSVNTIIQGSGAFLTNNSLIYINKFIEKHNLRSKVVLTVHDSIVIDCPPEEVHLMAKAARYIMENLPIDWLFIDWKGEKMRYPIAADVEIGVNYNDMVGYDMEEINTFSSIYGYCRYKKDLSKLEDYEKAKAITKEKYEVLVKAVEAKKNIYQNFQVTA